MLIHIVHSIIGKNAGGGSHHAITFLALVHHGNILNHHPLSFFPDVLLDIRLSGPGRSISLAMESSVGPAFIRIIPLQTPCPPAMY